MSRTKQVHINLTDREFVEVQRAAQERRASVNALVRAAVFSAYGIEPDETVRAVQGIAEGGAIDPEAVQTALQVKALRAEYTSANARRKRAQGRVDALDVQIEMLSAPVPGERMPQLRETQLRKVRLRRAALVAEVVAAERALAVLAGELATEHDITAPPPWTHTPVYAPSTRRPIAPPAWARPRTIAAEIEERAVETAEIAKRLLGDAPIEACGIGYDEITEPELGEPGDAACGYCHGKGILPGALTPCPMCREVAAMEHDAKGRET